MDETRADAGTALSGRRLRAVDIVHVAENWKTQARAPRGTAIGGRWVSMGAVLSALRGAGDADAARRLSEHPRFQPRPRRLDRVVDELERQPRPAPSVDAPPAAKRAPAKAAKAKTPEKAAEVDYADPGPAKAARKVKVPGVDEFDGRSRATLQAEARRWGVTVRRGAPAHEIARDIDESFARRSAADSWVIRFGDNNLKPGDSYYDAPSGTNRLVPTTGEYADSAAARVHAEHDAKLAALGVAPEMTPTPEASPAVAKVAKAKAPKASASPAAKPKAPKAPKAPVDVGAGASTEGRTVAQLRQIAAAEGIPLPKGGRRAELVAHINDHRWRRDNPTQSMVGAFAHWKPGA